ncbi:hypothetical protein BDN70DRAFT_834440 [Pholiota conissans]|uniref:Uncharacterized protein n=1 Tax=Pholiota conissans TaxID=109636 RepID=A0A9P5Z134_9AGAR|nr:hypothetical protein BDN70DRAFT_834440 [Pholiota conissans]
MADLLRSAASGGNWTTKELLAFNIRVVDANLLVFFGSTELPAVSANISATILNNLDMPDGNLSKTDRHFFQYLKAAEQSSSKESAVCDFAAFILGMLDYDDEDRYIRTRKEISFDMAGQRVDAKANMCVMNNLDYLLLIQEEDECQYFSDDLEPQLIAATIAAYYQNNLRRTDAGLDALPTILMPGITMVGTAPTFYRIPVSPKLLEALVTLTYPQEETIVYRCLPPVPDKQKYASEGMRPLTNRCIVLQSFQAFKASLDVI